MRFILIALVWLVCLLFATPTKSEDEFGLHHYSFDPDPLIDRCNKTKPLVSELMFDFLTMMKAESRKATQKCVLENKGPGFASPPASARTIFAATTMVYNTYARHTQHATPVTQYAGWTRMASSGQEAPNCAYIYGFHQIAHYLMPERVELDRLKEKYERSHGCDLTTVAANTISELGLVQRDVDELKLQLRDDGFNQEGCFADTTNFRAINPPCRFDNVSTIEICRDFTHAHDTVWNYGEIVKTGYIDAPRRTALSQSQQGRPFALERLYDYLAVPYFDAPAFLNGTMMKLDDQFLDLVEIQKGLDVDNDKPKLIAEHWADGPNTTATPGHWQSISLNIIRRLCYDNEHALKLLFAVSAATYDAGLAAWQNKRLYNSVRPATYIPTEHINGSFSHQFVGMYCDFQDIKGWQWSPYQEDRVITPEFQEYISGHSTFSRAASFVLEKFTGSPYVPGNLSVTIKAGESLFQPRCSRSNSTCYARCRVNSSQDSENNYIPKVAVTLGPWKTYRDIADEASNSRKYGGIHIASGDIQGRVVGQKVGEKVWTKLSVLFNESTIMTTTSQTVVRTTTNASNRFSLQGVLYLSILFQFYLCNGKSM